MIEKMQAGMRHFGRRISAVVPPVEAGLLVVMLVLALGGAAG